MFRPHYGDCINGHPGLIVVKAGLCDRCNEKKKQDTKADKVRVRSEAGFEDGKPKDKTIKALVELLDTIFSIYRRKIAADENGICTCVTCKKHFKWDKIQCGHYITREEYILRWDTTNTAPQCEDCNVFKRGEPEKFKAWIDEHYGAGTSDLLEKVRHQFFDLNMIDLLERIADTKKQLKVLWYVQ
jgi:hypothetical protein